MRPFTATVFGGLLAVAGVNFCVDPASRFLRRPPSIKANWSPEQVLVVPRDFDDRRGRAAHIAVIDRPELVFLGSSRVMMADGALLPGVKVYNAGVTGAGVEDYAALWQKLKAEGKVPRRVILYVDAWAFNAHSSQDRWRTNVALVQDFVAGVEPKDAGLRVIQARLFWQRLQRELGLAELGDLLSWSVLKTSVRRLRGQLAGAGPTEGAVIASADLPEGAQAWRSDGALIFEKASTRTRPLDELRKAAEDYAWQEDVYSIWHFEFDEQAYRILGALLKDMRAQGAEVLLVIPPYEPTVTRILAQRPAYKGVVPAAENALKRLAAAVPGVDYCEGSADAEAAGCAETEFMDSMHMQRSCFTKVLYRCLADAPGWKGLIPGPRAGRRSAAGLAGASRR